MYISTREIRAKFLDFFAKHHHTIVSSSSLVPHNDPSLMFVNSGMVQFKNLFTGKEKRNYTAAASSQKAVRAGGKHNDLDNVGYTTRHHTFFEMLGNFSFGQYFKEQAISYAWELLTKEFCIPKDRLYVTVYHSDSEAYDLWKKIANLSDDRIIKISTADNFWSMGDSGPCGPCSEIFYDHGDKIPGGIPGSKDQDGDRYVEIWNMVFMQYEQLDQNTRIDLPMKSIDTGMGLERIACVLQDKHDNYDTDCFSHLISAIEEATKVKSTEENKFSHRIIADHLRSCCFLIADGILPSNEGRGYVLRRIMRRSMRHIHQLGAKEPLMHTLVAQLNKLMADTYPELLRANTLITQTLYSEEVKFRQTLSKGLKLLEEDIAQMPDSKIFSGHTAFKLYDTYGFPLDLTQDILKSKNIQVDTAAFDTSMQEQKQRARQSWSGSGELKQQEIWFEIENSLGATEFLGYSFNALEANVVALISDNKQIQSIHAKQDNNQQYENQKDQEFWLIANQTPFYAESGGQKGDIGEIIGKNFSAKVIDTKKFLNLHAHLCILESGCVSVGSAANFVIEENYRNNLRRNHTATHLLHSALKQVLGPQVIQKGSLVSCDKLRFDINHHQPINLTQIEQIEQIVNEAIIANLEVTTTLMTKDDAISSGALALFGEKYDDQVRVVSAGSESMKFSVELCGGTHVSRTGDIGLFKIIYESSIASGIRRIEALTGSFALKVMQENWQIVNQASLLLQTNVDNMLKKIEDTTNLLLEAQKQISNLQIKLLTEEFTQQAEISQIKNITLMQVVFENKDNKGLKSALENIVQKSTNHIAIVLNNTATNSSLMVAVSCDLQKNLAANILLKSMLQTMEGNGGGSKNFAQGSCKSNALCDIKKIILETITKD